MVVAVTSLVAALVLAVASVLGAIGSTAQANLSRERMGRDPHIRVAQAASAWRDRPMWLWPRVVRTNWHRIGDELRLSDFNAWVRFLDNWHDLRAWNTLRAAVWCALGGSFVVIIGAIMSLAGAAS
jgi:hypothetical protein